MRASLFLWMMLAAAGRMRAVQHPSSIPTPRSVLWIAAHPDDESIIAPLLAAWCRDEHVRCGMLVMTRGDAGVCYKADGCAPDVATVRSAEAGAASQYFNAELFLLTLPDGGVINTPELAATIAGYIRAFNPEAVVTFDPRHGTTCHPDHRATGAIVLEAVKQLSPHPPVYLVETKLTITTSPVVIHFASASPSAQRYDANTFAWNAILDDMERHPSQFDASWIAAIQNVPASERAVFLEPAESALAQSVTACAP